MAYDYHGSFDDVTGFNAPLYGTQGDIYTVVSLLVFALILIDASMSAELIEFSHV